MNQLTLPSEQDLHKLRDQVTEQTRISEYRELHSKLEALQQQSTIEKNDESCLTQNGTSAFRKKKNKSFMALLLRRFFKLFSPRPVMLYMLALGIVFTVAILIAQKVSIPYLSEYPTLTNWILASLASGAIIRSAWCSLLLPAIATVIGYFSQYQLLSHITLHTSLLKYQVFHFDNLFYQRMFLVGILGLCVSVFAIIFD